MTFLIDFIPGGRVLASGSLKSTVNRSRPGNFPFKVIFQMFGPLVKQVTNKYEKKHHIKIIILANIEMQRFQLFSFVIVQMIVLRNI